MAVKLRMPGGGDENVNPAAVFVMRDATDVERDEAPQSQTCIWGAGFRIFPSESLAELVAKFSELKLARLTSPGGMAMMVSAASVTDRDDRSRAVDDERTNSVLLFGPGPLSPRLRVRETRDELAAMWSKLGLSTDPLS